MGKWLEEFERQQAEEAAQKAAAEAKKKRRIIAVGLGAGAIALAVLVFVLFRMHVLCLHEWSEPTCENPSTCAICGDTSGEALGHDWADATCVVASTCATCGETDGEPLGHEADESAWEVAEKATCVEPGEEFAPCVLCSEKVTREIEPLGHEEGKWKVVKKSVIRDGEVVPGLKALFCKRCGEKLETKEYEREAPRKSSSGGSSGSGGANPWSQDGNSNGGGSGGWHESESNATTVYTTDTGEKYHLEWCTSLRSSRHPTTVASAKSRGFEPCKICDPPS